MTFTTRFHGIRRRIARILAVARVETLHLIHDRTTLSLILLVPAVQIVLFGYAVNLDPRHIPIVIARDHQGPQDQVDRLIRETGYFMVVADGLKPGAAERMVTQGKALVGIELPARDDDPPSEGAKVIVDATDPAAVRPALAALEDAYWRNAAQLYAIGPVPAVHVEWLYNPQGRTAWTIVPGLAGVIVMISTLMLGALTLVRERERGSWETLLATPVDAIDALAGKLSPYVIIGTLQAAVVIWVARLLFDLPVTGDLWALLAAVAVFPCPSRFGVRTISSRGEPVAGHPRRGFFLSAFDAALGLYVPFPGHAGMGASCWGDAAAHTFRAGCSRRAP
jgi:ABC-2 type transport system permease protein